MNIRYYTALIMLLLSSCIKNDIPYPIITGEFISFEVEHQKGSTTIDSQNRLVTLELQESGNLSKVKVKDYSITENANINPSILEFINLNDSVVYTISTYQDYIWTIKATQNIERYFEIENQVGNQEINVNNLIAKVYVAKNQDIGNITIENLKLAPSDASYEPNPSTIKDFSSAVPIMVKYRDKEEVWTLIVEYGEGNPDQEDADILYLSLSEQISDSETIITDYSYNSIEGFVDINILSKELSLLNIKDIQLSEGASCEWKINDVVDLSEPKELNVISGSGKTKKWLIRAHPAIKLKNNNFSEWHKNGKVWNPYLSTDSRYWCTGNEGVVTLRNSNTTPIGNEGNYQGARLETVSLGFGGLIAKTPIAAGNIFLGDFITNMSKPTQSVKFGLPFIGRPKYLHCKYDYFPKINQQIVENVPLAKGDLDKGHIWIKILNANNTQNFHPETHLPTDAIILGEGEIVIEGEHLTGSEITISISYNNEYIYKMPTHIAIVCTSSYYGEFFVGGIGSVLNIYNLELQY